MKDYEHLRELFFEAERRWKSRVHPPTTVHECNQRAEEIAERLYACRKCKARFQFAEAKDYTWQSTIRGTFRLTHIVCPHCGNDLCYPVVNVSMQSDPHLQNNIITYLEEHPALAFSVSELMIAVQQKNRSRMYFELALLLTKDKVKRATFEGRHYYSANGRLSEEKETRESCQVGM